MKITLFTLIKWAAKTRCIASLLFFLCPLLLLAQNGNGITLSELAVNAGTVTFDISWDTDNVPDIWSDSVWVWVDYNKSGNMTRLTPSTVTASAGTVILVPGNAKGVWVVGDARTAGSFSATVQLLTDSPDDVGGACAYASNYPPVGEYKSATRISFTGAPLYDIVVKTPTGTKTRQAGSSYTIPQNDTVVSFTDKTGAPGFLKCFPAPVFTLEASASGFCEGDAGVTFALQGTENGRSYTLFQNGSAVATLTGTGSAATFSGAFKAGTYTAQSEADDVYCSVMMNGSLGISENPLPIAPTISTPGGVCENVGDLVFTASSYSGELVWIAPDGISSGDSYTIQPFGSEPMGTMTTVSAYAALTYSDAPTCYSDTVTQSATVNLKPVIITQPVESAAICANDTVYLSVGASHAMAYQWKKNGVNVMEGGTSAEYKTAAEANATYSVVVFNGSSCSVTSDDAVVTVSTPPSGPTGLSANVSTICSGVETAATLTATGGNVGSGAVYEWGTGSTVGSNPLSPATTTATTYSVSPNAATTYWVRLVGTGVCTATTTAGATTSIATYPAVSAGAIKSGSTTINFGETLNVTVTSTEVASGGNSSYTYRWRLTGTSSATLTTGTTATTYLLSISPSNYNAGTYYFNRYVRDATCSNDAAWVAATGTYTLIVNGPPSGSPPTTLCKQCCYDGSLWVDCYVTTNAHPFQNSTPNTAASWSGNAVYYSRATSDKNGRANTAAITGATTGSAVQLCKDLGTGWYLPAYEELYAMSSGAAGTYSNNRTGAGLLTPSGYYYWSSTEWYNHEGRIPQPDIYSGLIQAYMEIAMTVNSSGGIGSSHKTEEKRYVRCAWRK